MDLTVIYSVGILAIAALTFFVGRLSAAKSQGQEEGRLASRLDSVEKELKSLWIENRHKGDAVKDLSIKNDLMGKDIVRLQEQVKHLEGTIDKFIIEVRGWQQRSSQSAPA